MNQDVKFTISVIRNSYTTTGFAPKYEVIDYMEAKEIGDHEERIYGDKVVGYHKYEKT